MAYKSTLSQPYGVHVKRNSAEVITGITTHIDITVGAVRALLQLTASSVMAVSLLTGLLLIDAPVAVAAAMLFGSAYGLLAISVQRKLKLNSYLIAEASTQRLKSLQEGLGAIRDVLLDGTQLTYLNIYKKADVPKRQLEAVNYLLGVSPRFVLEAVGMVAIALLGGLLVLQRGSGAAVIPLLGALALGAQRLLPALQQIYSNWAGLKSCNASLRPCWRCSTKLCAGARCRAASTA